MRKVTPVCLSPQEAGLSPSTAIGQSPYAVLSRGIGRAPVLPTLLPFCPVAVADDSRERAQSTGAQEGGLMANSPEDGPRERTPASGPLRRHPENPRYFADGRGEVVYPTGSHTWGSIQDQLSPDPRVTFDFPAYVDWMEAHHFNFIRGWAWEQAAWDNHTREKLLVSPLPFERTGPGSALDGGPKFDLTRFEAAYYERIRSRAVQAGERGIYFSVMLFEGFSVDNRNAQYSADPWRGHPFSGQNNINQVDGDPGRAGHGRAVHTLAIPAVTEIQDAYVRRVVDAVNGLDNVLYEVGNEHYAESAQWQYHIVDLIHDYEAGKPKQHPVGMTSGGGGASRLGNAALFDGPADWVSPGHREGQPYRDDPPPADGRKVIITDTDHLWGLGATQAWVWKSFVRGLNPILMDPYEPLYGLDHFPHWGRINRRHAPFWEPIRRNLGYARRYAQGVDLANMEPRGDLVSTGYCLANPGVEYLAYLPAGGVVTVDLTAVEGDLAVEWLCPTTGDVAADAPVRGGGVRHLWPAFGGDAVLYLSVGA